MTNKPILKILMSVFVIVVGGLILYNTVFFAGTLVIQILMRIMGMSQNLTMLFLSRGIFLLLVILIIMGVFRSKLNELVKATFLTMLLLLVLQMIGLAFYQQSIFLLAVIGALILSGVVLFLYKKKLSWEYYFAVLYVAALGLGIMYLNMQS